MAKESGLIFTADSVDDSAGSARAIVNDVISLDFETPRGEMDATGLDKSAMERLLLLADFSVTQNFLFNDASNQSHDVFKTVPSTSVARTTIITLSGKTMACEVFYTNYSLSRSQGGELTCSAPGVLADGAVPTWA